MDVEQLRFVKKFNSISWPSPFKKAAEKVKMHLSAFGKWNKSCKFLDDDISLPLYLLFILWLRGGKYILQSRHNDLGK